MSEEALTWLLIPKGLIPFIFGFLYSLGGRSWTPKWIRRFLGSILFAVGVICLSLVSKSFSWWLLPAFIPFVAGLTVGYGAGDETEHKILARSLVALPVCGTALAVAYCSGSWFLGIAQCILALGASVALGVFNPTVAVDEEYLIGVSYAALIPFMV